MGGVSSPGFLLLKKQQESKLKRLDWLTVADYFNAMEDIRNGKPIKSWNKEVSPLYTLEKMFT